jgi:hypothetical protein
MAVCEQVQCQKRGTRQQSALVGAQAVDRAQEMGDSEKREIPRMRIDGPRAVRNGHGLKDEADA